MNETLSVSQSIAHELQAMIRRGDFAPDAKLPSQRVLSERLGVSRPSLREALMTLETLGLVRTYPARGTFVTGPETVPPREGRHARSLGDYPMRDVFELRILLERQLARHAARTTTGDDIAALREATDAMEAAWAAGDLVANVEADLAFHSLIARKSPNALLLQTYDSLKGLLTETQRQPIPFTPASRMEQSIAEHRSIADALHARDADAAEAAMLAHIRNTAACAGISL